MKFFSFLVAFGIAMNLNFFCYSFLFKMMVYALLKINILLLLHNIVIENVIRSFGLNVDLLRSLESFGDVWPLRDAQRNNIIKFGTSIVSNMNISLLASSEVRGKKKESEEESRTIDGRREAGTGSTHPSETTDGNDGSATKHPQPGERRNDCLIPITEDAEKEVQKPLDVNIHLDTTIVSFDRSREVTGSNLARRNLIDLLYNEGCISLLHKQHIGQQPTQQLQNLEMLQLIKNGSIKTFKVALEYFRVTNQDDVFDVLNRKYFSEGNLCVIRICKNIASYECHLHDDHRPTSNYIRFKQKAKHACWGLLGDIQAVARQTRARCGSRNVCFGSGNVAQTQRKNTTQKGCAKTQCRSKRRRKTQWVQKGYAKTQLITKTLWKKNRHSCTYAC